VAAVANQGHSVLQYASFELQADAFLQRFSKMPALGKTTFLARVAVHVLRFKLRLHHLVEAREVEEFATDWAAAKTDHVLDEDQRAVYRIGWEDGRKRARLG